MTEVSELEQTGELGHGSCGHVVKMRHRKTGMLMAVKVCITYPNIQLVVTVSTSVQSGPKNCYPVFQFRDPQYVREQVEVNGELLFFCIFFFLSFTRLILDM